MLIALHLWHNGYALLEQGNTLVGVPIIHSGYDIRRIARGFSVALPSKYLRPIREPAADRVASKDDHTTATAIDLGNQGIVDLIELVGERLSALA